MQAVKSGIYVQDAITKVETEQIYPPIVSRFIADKPDLKTSSIDEKPEIS